MKTKLECECSIAFVKQALSVVMKASLNGTESVSILPTCKRQKAIHLIMRLNSSFILAGCWKAGSRMFSEGLTEAS